MTFRLSGRQKGRRLARRMSQAGVTPRRAAASSGVRSLSDAGGETIGTGLASRAPMAARRAAHCARRPGTASEGKLARSGGIAGPAGRAMVWPIRILRYRHVPMAKRRAESREGMVITTVALPPGLHRRLVLAALEENAASAELIREAVDEWLDRRKRRGGRK